MQRRSTWCLASVFLSVVGSALLVSSGRAEDVDNADHEYRLVLIDQTQYPRAACLDGSPPGFYMSTSSSSSSVYVLHFQGGGWCVEDEQLVQAGFGDSCSDRASGKNPFNEPPSIGGSTNWPPYGCSGTYSNASVCISDNGNHGLISSSSSINPLLYDAVHVYINYCSGDSFAASRDAPFLSPLTNRTLYFRGLDNRRAIVNELINTHGMNQATMVLVAGGSAGGVAVFLGVDDIAAHIHSSNPKTLVLGLPGAGFILDFPAYNSPSSSASHPSRLYEWMVANEQMDQGGIPSACLSHFASEPYRCMFPQHVIEVDEARPTTPLFVVNSLIDAIQSMFVMQLGCLPPLFNCNSSQIDYMHQFHQNMVTQLQPLLQLSSSGAWLVECYTHTMEDDDHSFVNITIADATTGQKRNQRDTIYSWIKQQQVQWKLQLLARSRPRHHYDQKYDLDLDHRRHRHDSNMIVSKNQAIDTILWSAKSGGNPTCLF